MVLRVLVFAICFCACFAIQQEGLLPNLEWFEWPTLKSHLPQPMDKNIVFDSLKALRDLNDKFLDENLHRVDRYIINAFGEEFLFAWTKSNCHHVNHSAWRESNGHEFAAIVAADLHQYRHSRIFRGGRSSVAIEIGGHVGVHSIPIAFLAKQTIVFEPNHHSFSFLRANAALNPLLNISVHPFAVGSFDGEAVVKYATDDTNVESECNATIEIFSNSTSSPSASNKRQAIVRMVQLDTFLMKTYGADVVQAVGFIRIDANTFEFAIFESLRNWLSAQQQSMSPPVIQVECSLLSEQDKSKLVALGGSLLPSGYGAYCIVECDTRTVGKCPFRIQPWKSGVTTDNCNDMLFNPSTFSHLPHTVV